MFTFSQETSQACIFMNSVELRLYIRYVVMLIAKIRINSKIQCPQSPSFLVPRPRRLSEAIGYGDENDERNDRERPTE